MEEYLNTGIKQVNQRFPEIERILTDYNIGCAPCSVGTCLLKDIVEIHNLSCKDERELMTKIARVIFPGQEVEIPALERKKQLGSSKRTFSPPMQKLVDEHKIIKRVVALIPKIVERFDIEAEDDRKTIYQVIDFIRNYADKYHHAKEEDILFKYFDENLDILKVMHADHKDGRAFVQGVLAGLEGKDREKIQENLTAYSLLLAEHIKKEDEILYPWMDRDLSMPQVGEMFSLFNEVEKNFGDSPQQYEALVRTLEGKYSSGDINAARKA